jgi:hypothetical protein
MPDFLILTESQSNSKREFRINVNTIETYEEYIENVYGNRTRIITRNGSCVLKCEETPDQIDAAIRYLGSGSICRCKKVSEPEI